MATPQAGQAGPAETPAPRVPGTPFVGRTGDVAPEAGRVTVTEVATGRTASVWPIDARELVRSGEYVLGDGVPSTAAPVSQEPHPPAAAPRDVPSQDVPSQHPQSAGDAPAGDAPAAAPEQTPAPAAPARRRR